ncbi:hypothetical protein OH77DRAFT_352223 [Trametes cingulata]|nr:hypothetical protein OH77DRAFT_352223 [Trametes cingulata]
MSDTRICQTTDSSSFRCRCHVEPSAPDPRRGSYYPRQGSTKVFTGSHPDASSGHRRYSELAVRCNEVFSSYFTFFCDLRRPVRRIGALPRARPLKCRVRQNPVTTNVTSMAPILAGIRELKRSRSSRCKHSGQCVRARAVVFAYIGACRNLHAGYAKAHAQP